MKSFYTAACRLVVLLVVFCSGSSKSADGGAAEWASDYELKAAFVYNIASFVDWPPGVLGDRVVVGFAGEGPMVPIMTRFFAGKHVGSRLIEAREVHSRSELRACNILLVAYPDRSRVREALVELEGVNVLTLGDGEQFARLGGVIAFVPHDNTFQLAINMRAAVRARLKISSKLMSMATLVSDDETARRD